MTNEQIAKVCHEANRAYCETIGDNSQPHWEDAPRWQRESAINGIVAAHTGMSPEELHVNWIKGKLEDGWKYGPVKDADKKEHPCLLEYESLPEEQKKKDWLFHTIANVLKDAQ